MTVTVLEGSVPHISIAAAAAVPIIVVGVGEEAHIKLLIGLPQWAVRRHRASKPQGSSERVLPWQVTMGQLICASLSHTPYGYKVVIAF